MSQRIIIAEAHIDEFLSNEMSRLEVIQSCNIIHFVGGFIERRKIEKVLFQIERENSSSRDIQLSVSLNSIRPRRIGEVVTLENINKLFDLVDYFELDAETDLIKSVLDIIPAHKRIITRRHVRIEESKKMSSAIPYHPMLNFFRRDRQTEFFLYRILCDDGLAAVEFLHQVNERNVIAYDESEDGLWSRLCASYKGAPVIFSEFGKRSLVSLSWLQENYSISSLPEKINSLLGIAGERTSKSLSPLIQNKGLRALNKPAIYLTFIIKDTYTLNQYLQRLSAIDLPITGLTLTSPLKMHVVKNYQARRNIINSAQSANVLMLDNNISVLETTDDTGLNLILKKENIEVKAKTVAIIGCGCSGRIAAYMLDKLGAKVTLFNRGNTRGLLAQRLLNLPFKPLDKLDLNDFDILINTVPFKQQCDLSFSINIINPSAVFIDFVYKPSPNFLIDVMKRKKIRIIDGFTMLYGQLLTQFSHLTGESLPLAVAEELQKYLNDKKNCLGRNSPVFALRNEEKEVTESVLSTTTFNRSVSC